MKMDELYQMFKPAVFKWLDVISKGTNKENVKMLLTAKGISYTFGLPVSISNKFLNKWKKKQLP